MYVVKTNSRDIVIAVNLVANTGTVQTITEKNNGQSVGIQYVTIHYNKNINFSSTRIFNL
jgi:hypothetical protein